MSSIDDVLSNSIVRDLGIDDQQLPRLTATTHNIDDNVETVQEKSPLKTKKPIKRLKVVKF